MKGTFIAAVAALAGAASADLHHRHQHHELFAHKRDLAETCSQKCTTIWTTITGPPTLVPPPPPATTSTSTSSSAVVTTSAAPTTTSCPPAVVPTPEAHTCPTPGTYTFTATTITVSETTTVCAATTIPLPSGTHTVGGVTTIVETATTITCPVATVSTSGTVTTSTISMTTYVCPSSGTYTVAPTTTTIPSATTITIPVVTTYCPGTYTKPEQVVTVTETDYTTICPFSSVGLPTSSPAPAPAPAPSKAPAPPPAPKPAPSHKATPPPPPVTGGNGDHWGVTYTPYESTTGDCKSAGEVDSDLAGIKAAGFDVVRVYSTDCSTLENVGNAAEKYGLQLVLGIFVQGGGCDYSNPDIKEQVDAIAAWAKWPLVKVFVVGNEAIMNGYCSASQLAQLVTEVKSKCSGYSGPYTISETLNIWQNPQVTGALCDVVDLVGANIHAFFNPDVTASAAGPFVKGQLDILNQLCEGKKALNLECGWPTAGDANGKAIPGKPQQIEALTSIRQSCGSNTVFFSHENDYWKQKGAFNCEQSWGIKDVFEQLTDAISK